MKSLDMPQQMWLQSLISCRTITEAHAKVLHKTATTACSFTYKASEYDGFFSNVAKAVEIIGLEIRRTVDEATGAHVVGLVNTKGDEIAQLATTMSPHEITFVKMIIENIMKAPYESFCFGSKDTLEIAAELKPPIAATKAEAVCDSLLGNGWLRLSRGGRYTLTARSLMELQKYLESTYEGYVRMCTICEEILTSGFACKVETCDVRVHRHCLSRWETSLKKDGEGVSLCSRCVNAWESAPVGEAVLASHHADVREARLRQSQMDEVDGEEEIDEEEDTGEQSAEAVEEEGEEDAVEFVEERTTRNGRKRKIPAEQNGTSSASLKHEEEDELESEETLPRQRRRRSTRR